MYFYVCAACQTAYLIDQDCSYCHARLQRVSISFSACFQGFTKKLRETFFLCLSKLAPAEMQCIFPQTSHQQSRQQPEGPSKQNYSQQQEDQSNPMEEPPYTRPESENRNFESGNGFLASILSRCIVCQKLIDKPPSMQFGCNHVYHPKCYGSFVSTSIDMDTLSGPCPSCMQTQNMSPIPTE